MCLGLDFFGFYCLVFIELLESVGIYLLPYLGHFQPFLQLLSPALIFPSLCDSYNMNFRFFIISYVSETFSLQSIFLSAFKLNYFCCLSSNSLNRSSVHSILLLSSSTDFFLSYFSILKFPFSFSFCLLFLANTFYFFVSDMFAIAD